MSKDALFQVRLDMNLKREVEELYKNLGTSFAEAVRMFATQSVLEQKMPFELSMPRSVNLSEISGEEFDNKVLKGIQQAKNKKGVSKAELLTKHENRKRDK